MNKQLIEAYKEYIKILTDELDSLVGSAYVHGWRSSNVQAGIDARQKIAELSTPPAPDTTAKGILKKYKAYVSNIEWHINTNIPDVATWSAINLRLKAFKEIVTDLAAMKDYANQKQIPLSAFDKFKVSGPHLDKNPFYTLRKSDLEGIINKCL